MNDSRERLVELLTDRALVGLGQREQIELAELLVQSQDVEAGAFDGAASALALASIGALDPIPAELARSIEERAMAALEGRPASDFANTRQLDKLSPSLDMTQVDDILGGVPALVPTPIVETPKPFTRTHLMETPQPAPADVAPESTPTLARPNDPYLRPVSTEPRAFAPTSGTPSAPPVRSVPTPVSLSPMPLPVPVSSPPMPASLPISSGPRAHSSVPAPQHPHLVPGGTSAAPPSYPAQGGVPSSNVVPFRAPAQGGSSRAVAIGGWLAAAACLLLAIGAFATRTPSQPVVSLPVSTSPSSGVAAKPAPTPPSVVAALPSPAQLREQLLALAGTTKTDWSSTKDPAGKSTTGEVVWNKDQQKGVMRFRGLAKNDPTRAQYQLWIFDKTRDDKYPVDGGVFDVDSETGDVVVAIHAAIPVSTATLFAVTLEKPGGVVVSKRDRLVVVAKPAG